MYTGADPGFSVGEGEQHTILTNCRNNCMFSRNIVGILLNLFQFSLIIKACYF